jgi:hypothetical protein
LAHLSPSLKKQGETDRAATLPPRDVKATGGGSESWFLVECGSALGVDIRVSKAVVVFGKNNRRHKEKGGWPEIPMSRVDFLKNRRSLTREVYHRYAR